MTCTHHLIDVRWGLDALHALCTSLIDHQVWPSRIALIMYQKSSWCWKWGSFIGLSLYNTQLMSSVDCLYQSWLLNIAQPSSSVDCTHSYWPTHNRQQTLEVSCPHHLWLEHNYQRQAWPTHIAFGLPTMVNWSGAWSAGIAFSLHTMVKRCQIWATRIVYSLDISVRRR